jgi:hypothetical protein
MDFSFNAYSPLKTEFTGGASLSRLVVAFLFLHNSRLVAFKGVEIRSFEAIAASLAGGFTFEMLLDLQSLLEYVIVDEFERTVLVFFGVQCCRGVVSLPE